MVRKMIFRTIFINYTVINKLMTTEIMPQMPMAMELMAPWSSPISLALVVPRAWEQAPVASPCATGSLIKNHLAKSGAQTTPVRPATATQVAAMAATPP